jgi:antitoxin MazE
MAIIWGDRIDERPGPDRLALGGGAPYIQCRYMPKVDTTTEIARWGNSLAVRIPRALAQRLRLVEGTLVHLEAADDGALVIRPARPRHSLADLVARITPRNQHDETTWTGPVGRESW